MTAAELRPLLPQLAAIGASIPAAMVIELLELAPPASDQAASIEDVPLTCDQVAAALDRTPAAVRTWCRNGKVPGAFRLHGREWRIPRSGLRTLLEAPARLGVHTCAKTKTTAPRRPRSGLGSWRQETA